MTHKPVLKDRKLGCRKLALSKETLRNLSTQELRGIFGGDPDTELGTRTRLCGEETPPIDLHVSPFN